MPTANPTTPIVPGARYRLTKSLWKTLDNSPNVGATCTVVEVWAKRVFVESDGILFDVGREGFWQYFQEAEG